MTGSGPVSSGSTNFNPADVVVDIAFCSLVGATAVHNARDYAYAHGFKARLDTPHRNTVRGAIHQALQTDWVVGLTIRGNLVVQGLVTDSPVEIEAKVPLVPLLETRKILLSDDFSLNQVEKIPTNVEIRHVASPATDAGLRQARSIIKNPNLALIVAEALGRTPEYDTEKVRLNGGDVLYVARVTGGFLPKKAKVLPPNLTLEFIRLSFMGVNLYRHFPPHNQ